MVRAYATTYIGGELTTKQNFHEVLLRNFTWCHLGYFINHLLRYNSTSKFMFLYLKCRNESYWYNKTSLCWSWTKMFLLRYVIIKFGQWHSTWNQMGPNWEVNIFSGNRGVSHNFVPGWLTHTLVFSHN